MGHLPVSPLTQLCPWQPQGGILPLDLPSEQNHIWTSSAASNGCRKGMASWNQTVPAWAVWGVTGLGQHSCRDGALEWGGLSAHAPRGSNSQVTAVLQQASVGPAAGSGSADTEPSVFLGSQHLLRPAPTQHSPVQTSPVVTSACLWTLWGSSGCCKPFGTKVAHLVPKQDYSWAVGSSPSPLSLGQGYLARKEVVLSSLVHQTRTSPLEIRVPASLNPGKTWQLGLVCGRKWAVPMQAGPGEQKLSKLHLGTAGENLENRGIAQIRAATAWGTVRTAVAGILSSQQPALSLGTVYLNLPT